MPPGQGPHPGNPVNNGNVDGFPGGLTIVGQIQGAQGTRVTD